MGQKAVDGRTRRKMANRQAILKAAKDVFLTKGYTNNTMMEISQKAGVGYGTLYSHFKGKDDMLKSLIAEVVSEFNSIISLPYQPETIEDVEFRQVRETRYLLQLAMDNRHILQIAYEAMGRSETIKTSLDDQFKVYIDKAIEDLSYLCKKGLTKAGLNKELAAKSIVYLSKEFFWDVVLENESDIEAISKNITAIYLYGAAS
ncbi:MAG: TetR/AcrR family transcriptional regulator [Bacillota bacterium]